MNEDLKDSLNLASDTFDDAKLMAKYERYRGAMNRSEERRVGKEC